MPSSPYKYFGASLVFTTALTASGPVLSQVMPPEVNASQQADEHFRRGKALLQEGQRHQAYEQYLEAWKLKQTFDTAANLGNIELELGMSSDAAEHLAFSLRSYAVTGTTKEQIDRIKSVFAQARALVIAVSIHTNVDGAEVLVDGRTIGRSPVVSEISRRSRGARDRGEVSRLHPSQGVRQGREGLFLVGRAGARGSSG